MAKLPGFSRIIFLEMKLAVATLAIARCVTKDDSQFMDRQVPTQLLVEVDLEGQLRSSRPLHQVFSTGVGNPTRMKNLAKACERCSR